MDYVIPAPQLPIFHVVYIVCVYVCVCGLRWFYGDDVGVYCEYGLSLDGSPGAGIVIWWIDYGLVWAPRIRLYDILIASAAHVLKSFNMINGGEIRVTTRVNAYFYYLPKYYSYFCT